MRKRIILLLCVLACLQTSWAQNTMESIWQRYTDIKEYIANHTGTNDYDGSDWAEYYHVEARQFLPGTGGHKEDVYMYWNEREEEKIYPSHYLTFATTKYNYAAIEYYEEYLYDDDGNVAFIYAHDPYFSFKDSEGGKEYEFRFYLNKGKVIQAIIKHRDNGQEQYSEVYSGRSLRKEHLAVFEGYLEKSKRIHQMFIGIENEAYHYEE